MNSYFPHESPSEQTLYESIITESINFMGRDMYYIPRKLVAPDSIFNEDALSKFQGSYKICAYMDNIDNFGGAGSFLQKFGVYQQEQAQLTVSRSEWTRLVGKFGATIIPSRPCEGDLIWFPLTNSLLEIMYVEPQSPFYQVGQRPVWKFKVELFTNSSEVMQSNIQQVDDSMLARTFDLASQNYLDEAGIDNIVLESGSDIVDEPKQYNQKPALVTETAKILNFDSSNPFAEFER